MKIRRQQIHQQLGCYICKLPLGECLSHMNITPGRVPPGALGTFLGVDPRNRRMMVAEALGVQRPVTGVKVS